MQIMQPLLLKLSRTRFKANHYQLILDVSDLSCTSLEFTNLFELEIQMAWNSEAIDNSDAIYEQSKPSRDYHFYLKGYREN